MTYAIHAKHHFYAGTLDIQHDGVLRSDYDYRVFAFADRAEADALCKMLNDHGDGPTLLSHGQYAPSEHEVVESSAPATTLESAMRELGLQYDFAPNGERIGVE